MVIQNDGITSIKNDTIRETLFRLVLGWGHSKEAMRVNNFCNITLWRTIKWAQPESKSVCNLPVGTTPASILYQWQHNTRWHKTNVK